ncbi:P-loop containing nucleoside triphosphate hydrolases superfamily protein [Euphorbia peplus]|nr:P-loop containing nucleoside triphosphate hydrolases superfamily protein [Euphorbia peplus]
MQSKYGCIRKDFYFKTSISEVSMQKMSNRCCCLFREKNTRGKLHRHCSSFNVGSRNMEDLNSHKNLRRNASTASDISSISLHSTSVNSGSFKLSISWCFDDKVFLHSLFKGLDFNP